MNTPQTVEEWIALALKQGVVDKREHLPFTGFGGRVADQVSLVQWIRNHVWLPYDSGFDHGAMQRPISDEQRNDPEFMRGYADGLEDWKQTQQVDKGADAIWEKLRFSGLLTREERLPSSSFDLSSIGQTVDWQSVGRSLLPYAGLLSLLILCIRFCANIGGSDDGD